MKITDVPVALLRLQYQLARFPLHLIEQQVAARVDPEAPGRLFYERSLGTLDATVGRLLGDEALMERGAVRIERSATLGEAARLDAEATEKQARADATRNRRHRQAVDDQQEAKQTREQEVATAKSEAAQRKRDADKAAQKSKASAERQIDTTADQRVRSAQDSRRAKQATIGKAERAAVADASERLQDARGMREGAESIRDQADNIEELAKAHKRSRKGAP